MKKMIKICTIFLSLLMVFSLNVSVFAASSVTYDGDAQEFIFEPGSKHSPTDLFTNFKDVMPGDILTEQILIKNDAARGVKIRLYMRSLGAQEGTDEFLSQMDLSVKQNGDSILFEAPADETAQLTDWIYLGTIYSGGEILLDVNLEVPLTMGNEFQENIGYIDWEFKIEELPVEPGDPEAPQTGDDGSTYLYVGGLGISLAVILAVLFWKKRK